jgi:hypothetical protein
MSQYAQGRELKKKWDQQIGNKTEQNVNLKPAKPWPVS